MTTNPTAPQDGGEKLAPCPLCHGDRISERPTWFGLMHKVACDDCGIRLERDTRLEAIKHWNCRVTSDPTPALDEAEIARAMKWIDHNIQLAKGLMKTSVKAGNGVDNFASHAAHQALSVAKSALQKEARPMAEQEMLPVTEADRSTYLRWSILPPDDQANVVAGHWDSTTGMQILARHRLAATKAADERVRVLTEALREIAKGRGLADQTQIARVALVEAGGRHG